MKKLLALTLVLIMLCALVACQDTGDGGSSSTKDPTGTKNPPVSTKDPSSSSTPSNTISFTTVDETVYVLAPSLNLRTSTSFDSKDNIAGDISKGTEVKRIGFHEEWSKIVYNSKTYYVASQYLGKEKPSEETAVNESSFTTVNETVYIAYEDFTEGTVNAYTEPSRAAEIAKVISIGTQVTRTGVYYEDTTGLGWSRIVYNSETYYVRNSCLALNPPSAGTDATTTTAAAN